MINITSLNPNGGISFIKFQEDIRIMNFKLTGFLLFIHCLMNFSYSQEIDCRAIYSADSAHYIKYISSPVESPPIPYGSYNIFFEKLKNEVNDIDERGKVFIRFAVDTLGNAQCLKVMKSDNELLNAKALEIIEETKFSPATQQGKKVVAPMVLPITFGEPPKKKKGKK